MKSRRWSLAERDADLAHAERDGVDLLVIGGGITGAGVLRDAATRGMRALLVEREDFASGTSSRSSKFVHGGLRYIGEGHLGLTREACRERDRLRRLAPHLIEPIPLLFPAYETDGIPLWQVRAALSIYAAMANFRSTSRFRMLGPDEVKRLSPDLRTEGLSGAGFYHDARVDDARLVLETLRSARFLGCPAVNHAEVVEFARAPQVVAPDGPALPSRITAARVLDRLSNRTRLIRAEVVVNAAGPAIDRVRGLDRPVAQPELRPAKGIHLVIPGGRIHTRAAVSFQALDGRHLFFAPWGDVALIGTTDSFTSEIDEPVATIEEVHYLLSAANRAFPCVGLTTNDLCSVFAGVRPLAADAEDTTPPSSVSREDRIYSDPSGLLSAAGGKLTTYRAMGEKIVDRVVGRLSPARRRVLGPSTTTELPLRDDDFDRDALERELGLRFGVGPVQASHLVRTYGAEAEALLGEAPPELRRPIDRSRYTLAEVPWCIETECPATLCDVLERRVRAAIFAAGQGLPDLASIAEAAGAAAGWDAERTRAETLAYAAAVRRRYQIAAPVHKLSAA
jgi:glycerol-3-phosphate dehydrogenase